MTAVVVAVMGALVAVAAAILAVHRQTTLAAASSLLLAAHQVRAAAGWYANAGREQDGIAELRKAGREVVDAMFGFRSAASNFSMVAGKPSEVAENLAQAWRNEVSEMIGVVGRHNNLFRRFVGTKPKPEEWEPVDVWYEGLQPRILELEIELFRRTSWHAFFLRFDRQKS